MQPFTAAPHQDVLVLLIQVAVLLLTARGLGEVAQRLGQPTVIGEIIAGVLLGPSCVSAFVPGTADWLVPQSATQGYLLEVVSLFGVMFLLLITGLETDLPLIRRHARTAIGVSAGGVLVTFSSGFVLGWALPASLLADPQRRLVFALFVATAMSISAIPVIAKVLIDLNLMRRDIGQTIIAAGMSDDTTGWVLLSVVAGLASGHAIGLISLGRAIGYVAVFMVLSFTLGRWLVKRALDLVQDEVTTPYRLHTLVVVFMLAWGALAQALQLEAVLGAFVIGIVFGQMPRLPEAVHRDLKAVTLGIFAPIFFGVAGLKVNVLRLLDPKLVLMTLVVIAVASAGKVVGTYLGARLIGRRDHWTALSFGAGLNARGAMEIIVATIGLSLGILTQDMFSIIVVMAMATSLMAPAALRRVLARIQPEEQELKRLRQEELTQGSLAAGIHRVLIPVRLREGDRASVQPLEAQLLRCIGTKTNLSVTLLSVVPSGKKLEGAAFLDQIGPLFAAGELTKKVVEAPSPGDVILDEAQKDYHLLVLGASEAKHTPEELFSHLIDYVVRVAPCATLVVHGQNLPPGWAPNRMLVPTNGTVTARRAAEIAFALASSDEAEVIVLNVVQQDRTDPRIGTLQRQLGSGYEIVQELCTLGESLNVRTRPEVRVGMEVERVILDTAASSKVRLIVLGTDLRPGSDRLFLGPGVERILRDASCPVVVVNTPS